MNTSNTPITRPYSGQDAPWRDRQWFDQRPERQYRLRPTHKSELSVFAGYTHILVQKISSTERQRKPLSLLAVPPEVKALLQSDQPFLPPIDAVLGEMFAQEMSGRTINLQKLMRNVFSKFKAVPSNPTRTHR